MTKKYEPTPWRKVTVLDDKFKKWFHSQVDAIRKERTKIRRVK